MLLYIELIWVPETSYHTSGLWFWGCEVHLISIAYIYNLVGFAAIIGVGTGGGHRGHVPSRVCCYVLKTLLLLLLNLCSYTQSDNILCSWNGLYCPVSGTYFQCWRSNDTAVCEHHHCGWYCCGEFPRVFFRSSNINPLGNCSYSINHFKWQWWLVKVHTKIMIMFGSYNEIRCVAMYVNIHINLYMISTQITL